MTEIPTAICGVLLCAATALAICFGVSCALEKLEDPPHVTAFFAGSFFTALGLLWIVFITIGAMTK